MYSSATQDCANKFAVARHVYGFPFTQPFPDVDRTAMPDHRRRQPRRLEVELPAGLQSGAAAEGHRARAAARVFVVDPRRTETAKVAGEHVFIRPGTDVFFYLAFLHELIATGGVDRARVERFMTGFDEVARLAAAVDAGAHRRGDAASRPRRCARMVAAYRTADGAALYCSTGVNMGGNGALAFWLQEVINAVSGNLDRARRHARRPRASSTSPRFGGEERHRCCAPTARASATSRRSTTPSRAASSPTRS